LSRFFTLTIVPPPLADVDLDKKVISLFHE